MATHAELPLIRQPKAQSLRQLTDPARREGELKRREPRLAAQLGQLGAQEVPAAQDHEQVTVGKTSMPAAVLGAPPQFL